uniref:CUE domain-containing protein n=1 Tax=Strongyloides stercoralis TaxID=6248 RepID=A0A0K0DVH3_STRER
MFLIIFSFIIGCILLYFFNINRKNNIYSPQGENIVQTASIETSLTLFDKTQLSDFTKSLTDYLDIRSKPLIKSNIQKDITKNPIIEPTEISSSVCSNVSQNQDNMITSTATTIKDLENQQKSLLNKSNTINNNITVSNENNPEKIKNTTNKTNKQSLEWSLNEVVQLDPATKAAEEYRLKLLKKRHDKSNNDKK